MKRFILPCLLCAACLFPVPAQVKRLQPVQAVPGRQEKVFDVSVFASLAGLWDEYAFSLEYGAFVSYADALHAVFMNPPSSAEFMPYAVNEALFFLAFIQSGTAFAAYQASFPDRAREIGERAVALARGYYAQPSNADLLLGSLLRSEELERLESACKLAPGTIGLRTPDFPPQPFPPDAQEERRQLVFKSLAGTQVLLPVLSENPALGLASVTAILSQPDAVYILSEFQEYRAQFERLQQAVLSVEYGSFDLPLKPEYDVLPSDLKGFSRSWQRLSLLPHITGTLAQKVRLFYSCAILIDGLRGLSVRYGFPCEAVISPGIGEFWDALCFPPYLASLSDEHLSFLHERLLISARNAFLFARRTRSAQYERRGIHE